jgi:hypothetical protein
MMAPFGGGESESVPNVPFSGFLGPSNRNLCRRRFVTMGLCVIALLVRILGKKWHPGPFTLGAFTLPVVVGAAGWIVFEVMNLAWPRGAAELPWYVSWAVPIGLAGIAAVGFLVWLSVRDRIKNVNQDLHEHHEIVGEEGDQTAKSVPTS